MLYRTIAIIVLLIAGNLAVAHIRNGYSMGKVIPPTRELSEVQLQLGPWRGTDVPSNARIKEKLRARSGIDRVYQDERGQNVVVHLVWTDDYIKLHFPQQCYREAGWEYRNAKDVVVKSASGKEVTAKTLGFRQAGRDIRVLYWFQFGEHVFLDRFQHRLLRRQVCWGQKEWPPLLKFMLETTDDSAADERLIDLAGRLHGEVWQRTMRNPSST